ncbi:type IVB secretion system protein IcmH/DotU [Methyloferula stellata]|uniref:type IVB secretion system protein IcmH/DotU n=1 Tax=Methyloferula stellata TaxID=876270 RepID=UPI00036ACADA|nr:type IVB secretion system protein IcmH/DotU [Methyloferula stellata]
MSDKDKMPNVPGGDDRTVFRPSPAPRKVAVAPAPTPGAPPPPPHDDNTVFRSPPPPRTPGQAPAPPPPPPANDKAGPAIHDDRTVFRPNPGGRRPVAPPPIAEPSAAPLQAAPRQAVQQSAELQAPNDNPILRAALPLLLLLGRLRTSLVRAPASSLTPQITEAVQTFETHLKEAGISSEQANAAKYILCATADKVLANLPGDDRPPAARGSLMSRFFGEAMTGQKVFSEIERVKLEPGFYPVVELAHACLALGFQGAPRTSTTADALERDVQHDLYEIIGKAKARQSRYLSPHWEGQSLPSQAVRLYVPFWAVAGAVALSLFILFIVLRTLLGHNAEQAAQTMVSLNPPSPVTLARRSSVPPPAPAPQSATQISQLEHIRKVLQPNIAAGLISIETTPNQIIIRAPEKGLFQPGKTSLSEDGRALLMSIISALDDEKGQIKVIGHSDNTPVSNARFASNFEVSQAFANTVASVLRQSLSQPDRVEAEGKGSDAPIASNDTPQGREKNRRIDMVIARSD